MDKPQRVKGDIVQRLKIRNSRARDLPIFLHARYLMGYTAHYGSN